VTRNRRANRLTVEKLAHDCLDVRELMSRPNMRFVAVKREDQQATLMALKFASEPSTVATSAS
jgi:hypothetical protein